MANKSNQDKPGQKAVSAAHRASRRTEYDDAVTTDIPDVLENAFDEHQGGDPSDLFITDVSLTEHVDLESDDLLPPGLLLRDRFEIVELVYAAGMSHVYKAIDQRRRLEGFDDIHVAIKTMRPSIASNDHSRIALEREAAKTQSLSHPNIINIYDFDDHDGQFFLVMEWLEGESVNTMLRRTDGEAVDAELARKVITLAATGVQHAHRNNVVHADINPSNIFITDTHEIKLLDFGVARFVSTPEQSEEDRFTWVTQTYASPEVLSGSPPVVEDDVFSLACVVYRLLKGEHPFGGSPSLVAKQKDLTVEPIPGLPARQWDILRRALSYDREDRPSGVSDFVTWGATAAANDVFEVLPDPKFMLPKWTWPAATAAVLVLAAGFWLVQRGAVDEIAAPVEPALPEQSVAAESAISASEALVIAATRALDEGQLIAPEQVSARALFRAALVLESDNAEALRGLRTISDDYVQQAHAALSQDDPVAAYAALTVAAETDPQNPTVEIVNQLLMAKGDGELAEARLAITTGELEIAAQKISRAERYQHIEPVEVRRLRQQIEDQRELRAAAAVASTDAAQENERLDAVDALGDPAPGEAAAAASLTAVEGGAQTTDALDSQVAEEQLDGVANPGDVESPPLADEQPASVAESTDVAPERVVDEPVEDTLLQAAASQPLLPEEASPQAATAPAEPEIRRYSLRELGIRDYTAPEFPRRALRRNISGFVEAQFVINPDGRTESIEVLHSEPGDLFSRSAVNAIDKWRFETREGPFDARIILRFEQE
ncbi:MAG: TonB family protein [Chromatiales bacterium]|nr:MAG: TonB family protein [Chromatiales bacterium]